MSLDKNHREARRIMSEHLKRDLTLHDIVHHKDNDPSNNRISNLQVMTLEEHSSIHKNRKGKKPKYKFAHKHEKITFLNAKDYLNELNIIKTKIKGEGV